MNIISTIYFRVTTFTHLSYNIFLLQMFHVNITVITIDGCIHSYIIIPIMASTLSYAWPFSSRFWYIIPISFVYTEVTQEYTITHNPTVFDILIPTQIISKHGDNNILHNDLDN